MRRTALCAAAAAFSMLASVPAIEASGATTPPSCTHVSKITSTWIKNNRGFTGSVRVTNLTSAPVRNWTITWSAGSKPTLLKVWSARWTQSGKTITVHPAASNATIYPNKSITFGFLAAGAATPPTNVKLNKLACS
jgi:cellulase/cellobiase CelA1